MGLKATLIKKASSPDAFKNTQPARVKEDDKATVDTSNDDDQYDGSRREISDADISNALESELDSATDIDEEIDLDSFTDEMSDSSDELDDIEPKFDDIDTSYSKRNSYQQPKQQQSYNRKQPVARVSHDYDEDDGYNMPEPVAAQPEPPVKKRRRRKKVVNEPEKTQEYISHEYESNDTSEQDTDKGTDTKSYSRGKNTRVADSLSDKLLSRAKNDVLSDVVESFDSEIVTKKALERLVSAYLSSEKKQDIANGNTILSTVIDEVIDSKFVNKIYDEELTREILLAIRDDLD